jgi:hypothetical protein
MIGDIIKRARKPKFGSQMAFLQELNAAFKKAGLKPRSYGWLAGLETNRLRRLGPEETKVVAKLLDMEVSQLESSSEEPAGPGLLDKIDKLEIEIMKLRRNVQDRHNLARRVTALERIIGKK